VADADWATARGPPILKSEKALYVNNKKYAVKDTIDKWN